MNNIAINRRAVFILLLLVVTPVVLWVLYNIWNKSTIIISVPDNTTSYLNRIDPSGRVDIWSSPEPGEYSQQVSPGNYEIVSVSNASTTKRFVEASRGEEYQISLSLTEPLTTLPTNTAPSIRFGESQNGPVYLTENNELVGLSDGYDPNRFFKEVVENETQRLVYTPTGTLIFGEKATASDAVFGDSNSQTTYLLVDRVGDGFFITNEDSTLLSRQTGQNKPLVISSDYDASVSRFCVLFSDQSVATYSASGAEVGFYENVGSVNNITCSNNQIVAFQKSLPVDGVVRDEVESIVTTIISGVVETRSLAGELSDVVLFSDSKAGVVLDNTLYEADINNFDLRFIGLVGSPESSSLFPSATQGTVLLNDGSQLWRVAMGSAEYRLIAEVFGANEISEVLEIDDTEILLSVSLGSQQGTYTATNNQAIINAWDSIGSRLPINTADYKIRHSVFNNKIEFQIVSLSPIPSSGLLDTQNRTINEAREYISSLGIDSSIYSLNIRR